MAKRRTIITKSMVKATLEEIPGCTLKKIMRKLRCHDDIALEHLKQLRLEGLAMATPNGNYKNSFLYWPSVPREPVIEPSIANVYVQPFRPLTGYNPFTLQRLCEGGRKADTGMA